MSKKDRIQLSDHFTYKRLFAFVLPTIANMVFLSIYGIVDGLFISNWVGKIAFASVNVTFPIFGVLGVFGLMIGTGGSAIIGKTLGEQNPEKANGLFSFFVYVCIAIGIVMGLALYFWLKKRNAATEEESGSTVDGEAVETEIVEPRYHQMNH